MGFNPCFLPHVGCYMLNLGEAVLGEMALAIATNGMRDAGYTVFALDDGWAGPRLPNGTITAARAGFPSGTLAPLAAYVASLGLRLGAYTDRGASTCAGRTGSRFEANPPCAPPCAPDNRAPKHNPLTQPPPPPKP